MLRSSRHQCWLAARLLAEAATLAASFQPGGPPAEASPHVCPGRRTSRTRRFVSRWEFCLLLPSRYLQPLGQRGARPRTRQPPRKGRVHQGNAVWSCVHADESAGWARSEPMTPSRCQSAGHFMVFGNLLKGIEELVVTLGNLLNLPEPECAHL